MADVQKSLEDYGKDSVWCFQTGRGSANGAHVETLEALQFLGTWFKEHTGHMLVITAITNGSHSNGEHSHANGWKIDCNDWAGPEGLQSQYFGDDLEKPLSREFAKAGAAKGLGMNIESPGTNDVHWDISVWGDQWTGPFSTGNNGGWNGCSGSGHPSNLIWNGPAGSASPAGQNSNSNRTEDHGSKVILKPYKKTFCEPMYPDLQVLPGNIPTSLVEQIVSKSNKSQDVGTSANPYKVMTSKGMSDATGLDLGGFTTDSAQIQRQKTYNVKDNINDRKISGGKPLNNNDRYPVDLKAEELLLHEPKIKQNEIAQGTSGLRNVIDSVLIGLDHAEKRVVKLENVLATMMRYLFGVAGRMHINCVYYGGQDYRNRYKNIRCMRDDRVNDGQVMQLDQCLSCTRYEPIFGQTYDILNELGSNAAMIIDDTQMGYMNLRDYAAFQRIEELPTERENADFDISMNQTRSSLAVKFKDEWDQGVKMKWKLTPKENQKPIINWRQDINKPDKSPKKLPSFQYNMSNVGSQTGGASVASDACPIQPGNCQSIMVAHYKYMSGDGHKLEEVAKFFDAAKDWAMEKGGNGRSALASINTQKYADTLNKLSKEKGVDPMLMFSIFTVESGAIQGKDGGGIAQLSALKDKKSLTQEEDIGTAIDAIKGYLQKYGFKNPMLAVTLFGAGAGSSKLLQKKNTDNQMFDKDWIGTLKMEFDNNDEIYEYWPKVVCSYIFFVNCDTKKSVLAQGDAASEYDFLFKDADLDKINFVKDYGGTNEEKGNSSLSQSITFHINTKDTVEVLASKAGSIIKTGSDELGKYIRIKYDNDSEMEYHGLSSISDEAQKGSINPGADSSFVDTKTVLGKASESVTVIYYSGGKPEDPKLVWPSLRGKESKDNQKGTLGAIVKQGQENTQTVTAKDSVVVGGNTDGTYDMDDLANYNIVV